MAEFDEALWTALAHRVPAFEALRIERAWAGYYEMNLWDHNALLGAWPPLPNLLVATGFSGHGMHHAPAVGCALAARIAGHHGDAPDIGPLSPARVAQGQPLRERNVI